MVRPRQDQPCDHQCLPCGSHLPVPFRAESSHLPWPGCSMMQFFSPGGPGVRKLFHMVLVLSLLLFIITLVVVWVICFHIQILLLYYSINPVPYYSITSVNGSIKKMILVLTNVPTGTLLSFLFLFFCPSVKWLSSELSAFPTMVKFFVNGAWQAFHLPGHFGKPWGLITSSCDGFSTLATNAYHLIRQNIGYPGRAESHHPCTWVQEGVGLSFIQLERIVGSFYPANTCSLKIWGIKYVCCVRTGLVTVTLSWTSSLIVLPVPLPAVSSR